MMLSDIGGTGRRHARDFIVRGPRGVGKTVLLTRFHELGEAQGFDRISLQATQGGVGMAAGILAGADAYLRHGSPAWRRATETLHHLAAITDSASGIRAEGLNADAQEAPLDPRALAQALATVAQEIRCDAPGGGLLVTIDELQVSHAADLALLAATLECLDAEHADSPVAFAASALLAIKEVLRDAGVTDAACRFEIPAIPVELDRPAARFAIVEPARARGVVWSEVGVERLIAATHGYPAHVQLFADAAWKLAAGPREVTAHDVERGIAEAEQQVEARTLEPRWRSVTDRHAELLAALAVTTRQTDRAYATSAEISDVLGRPVNEWSAARMQLIYASDIYAPARGCLAFTVPSYAPYVLREYEARRAEARLELTALSVMSQRLSRT